MFLSLIFCVFPWLAAALSAPLFQNQAHINPHPVDVKVPVQLGVMSKCPDALLCETTFKGVMDKVKDKIDIGLVYIGTIDELDPEYGVTCMHGPEECAGNVQQLCVNKYATRDQWWAFVQCQNFEGRGKIGKPDVALRCADAVQIDWDGSGAGKCTGMDSERRGEKGAGKEGKALLKGSVMLAKHLGITTSCTIMINERKVCVHDSTWKDCENGHTVDDFVRQINEEYDRLNSSE